MVLGNASPISDNNLEREEIGQWIWIPRWREHIACIQLKWYWRQGVTSAKCSEDDESAIDAPDWSLRSFKPEEDEYSKESLTNPQDYRLNA